MSWDLQQQPVQRQCQDGQLALKHLFNLLDAAAVRLLRRQMLMAGSMNDACSTTDLLILCSALPIELQPASMMVRIVLPFPKGLPICECAPQWDTGIAWLQLRAVRALKLLFQN